MSLLQIAMIWGAASAALFPFASVAGEWEEYQALKDALVRSSARRDYALPRWVANLDYPRPYHFYDVPPKKTEKRDDSSLPSPAAAARPDIPDGAGGHK